MKLTARLLLLILLGIALCVRSQSMSPPNAVGKDQVLKMALGLTNGMPEQAANALLTNQGLHCSYTLSETNARLYRYDFTNGWFDLQVKPKRALPPEQWYRNTDGFLTAASINWFTNPVPSWKDVQGTSLSLTNAP